MLPILVFGMIVGLMLRWIQPERHGLGYIGSALLGSMGTFVGVVLAVSVADTLRSESLLMMSMLMMGAGLLIMLFAQKLSRIQ